MSDEEPVDVVFEEGESFEGASEEEEFEDDINEEDSECLEEDFDEDSRCFKHSKHGTDKTLEEHLI
jgi:excinuclease ABC subunit A